jgi:hypothetical protein
MRIENRMLHTVRLLQPVPAGRALPEPVICVIALLIALTGPMLAGDKSTQEPLSKSAQPTNHSRLEAGPLTLEIYISKTAHLFHVVDQISQWSEFCHRQYVSYFDRIDGGLSEKDTTVLREHVAIRKRRGWNAGLEQTFYSPLSLESALADGIKHGFLTEEEAQTERRVFSHFQARVERLLLEEAPTLRRFEETLSGQQSNLMEFATTMSRFVGAAKLTVPFYLIANPHERDCGGGYNGGRLTLEIAKSYDMYPTLLHELVHAFAKTKGELIRASAQSVPGLDEETLNEGLAYAYSPGLVRAGAADRLLAQVTRFAAQGSVLRESYPRFNAYGLALRPLLKLALADKQQTLETFLPRAVDAWLVLAELDQTRSPQKRDYRADPRHSVFIFGPWDAQATSHFADRHCFGRSHAAADYREMLTKNAKPGDIVILLLSLDDSSARVPDEFSDLLPCPWSETESDLKEGKTVFKKAEAREMSVFLLAAPTAATLQEEFRRLTAEKNFSP